MHQILPVDSQRLSKTECPRAKRTTSHASKAAQRRLYNTHNTRAVHQFIISRCVKFQLTPK